MVCKKLQTTQEKKRRSLLAKIDEATSAGLQSAILDAEVQLEEFDAHQEQQADAYKKLDDELNFLIRYESELAKLAEQSRIDGATDDEMYQINMETEVYLRNLRKIETEQVARSLGISQATAEESMRIPQMRTQLLNTAMALTLPDGAQKDALAKCGINLNLIPLSVQEELKLSNILSLGENKNVSIE